MIKVLLVDNHEIVRFIMRQILEKAGDIQVVAMASDGQEAVNKAVTHCPNVVVMDISMPIMDGVEATRQICAKYPKIRVLMVSMYHTPPYVHHSMEAGALGYVLKDDISRDLITAVRTLHQGGVYFSKQVAELAKLYIHGDGKTNTEAARAFDRLNKFKSDITFLFLTSAIFVDCLI